MGGIKSDLRSMAPLGALFTTQDDEGEEQPLIEACAGTRIAWRCRESLAFVDPVSAPAATQWEGPFIRIRPRWGDLSVDGRKVARGTMCDQSTPYASSGGGVVTPLGNQPFYYDVDAFGQSSIYLPFDASLSVLSVRSGIALWDVWQLPKEATVPPTFRQEFTQSRWARDGQSRNIIVPFGAQELAFIGQPFDGDITIGQEDVPKTVGLGSTLVPINMFGPVTATGTAGMRIPCGGMRSVQLTPRAGRVVGVAFYITI